MFSLRFERSCRRICSVEIDELKVSSTSSKLVVVVVVVVAVDGASMLSF